MTASNSSKTATKTDDGTIGLVPHEGSRGVDLISKLPDDILANNIIARLPTKEAARTQALARSWGPLWRSAPLNLHVDYGLGGKDESERRSIVSKILAGHLAPARRFYFNATLCHECQHSYMEEEHAEDHADQIQSWFCSRALDNLEEVDINLGILYYYDFTDFLPLPPAVIPRCASTIVVAKFSVCDFRKEMAPWPSFPFLKQLTLQHVYIHEDAFLGMLSSCHALESLYVRARLVPIIWG
jgi:hypothetical protein